MENKAFTIRGALREGWELTKVNIGFLVAFQIIVLFITWLFSPTQNKGWESGLIFLIGILIATLGKMGFFQSTLFLTKGLKPSFNQLYANWRLLFSWLIGGFFFGIMFVVGLAFLIIPGLYVWGMFGFFPFFILDKGLGPIEALKQSAEATKGATWHTLLLFLACTALNILGFLCLGIGILITAPVTVIAMAAVYRRLAGQAQTSIQPDDIL